MILELSYIILTIVLPHSCPPLPILREGNHTILSLSFKDLSIVLEWSYCLSFITLPIFNRSTKILEDEVPLLKELGNFAKTTASERNG